MIYVLTVEECGAVYTCISMFLMKCNYRCQWIMNGIGSIIHKIDVTVETVKTIFRCQ